MTRQPMQVEPREGPVFCVRRRTRIHTQATIVSPSIQPTNHDSNVGANCQRR